MQPVAIRYVGGPLDSQMVSVAGANRPPILHASAFTREGQECIALYARQGDEGRI